MLRIQRLLSLGLAIGLLWAGSQGVAAAQTNFVSSKGYITLDGKTNIQFSIYGVRSVSATGVVSQSGNFWFLGISGGKGISLTTKTSAMSFSMKEVYNGAEYKVATLISYPAWYTDLVSKKSYKSIAVAKAYMPLKPTVANAKGLVSLLVHDVNDPSKIYMSFPPTALKLGSTFIK